MIRFEKTADIYDFFGYNDDYDNFSILSKTLEDEFKYGSCIFDTGFDDHVYFLALDHNKLVGFLKFKVGGSDSWSNPGFKNWICIIEVHKDYRNNGISTHLREMLFQHCAKHNLNILSSGFTLLGHKYNLKGYIHLAKKYNVEYCYIDSIKHPNFDNFEGLDEDEYKQYYDSNKADFFMDERPIIINKK